MRLNEIPTDSYERENFLWNYVVGKVTQPMIERLGQHLSPIIHGKNFSSAFGREAAEKIQSLSREEFSQWLIEQA